MIAPGTDSLNQSSAPMNAGAESASAKRPGGAIQGSPASKFIQRHGYSYKAYWIAVLAFPPAANFIALKKPGLSLGLRIIGSIIPVVVPMLLLSTIGTLIALAWKALR